MARTKKTSTKKKPKVEKAKPETIKVMLNPGRLVPPDGFPCDVGDMTKRVHEIINLRHGIVYDLPADHPVVKRYLANELIKEV